jgi:hypothetical protein
MVSPAGAHSTTTTHIVSWEVACFKNSDGQNSSVIKTPTLIEISATNQQARSMRSTTEAVQHELLLPWTQCLLVGWYEGGDGFTRLPKQVHALNMPCNVPQQQNPAFDWCGSKYKPNNPDNKPTKNSTHTMASSWCLYQLRFRFDSASAQPSFGSSAEGDASCTALDPNAAVQ